MRDIYMSYLSDTDREFEAIQESNNLFMNKINMMTDMIEMNRNIQYQEAEYKVLTEGGTYEDLTMLYEAANEEAEQKKKGIIGSLIDGVINTFEKIVNWFKKTFGSKKIDEGKDVSIEDGLLDAADKIVEASEKTLPTCEQLANTASSTISNVIKFGKDHAKVLGGLAFSGIQTLVLSYLGAFGTETAKKRADERDEEHKEQKEKKFQKKLTKAAEIKKRIDALEKQTGLWSKFLKKLKEIEYKLFGFKKAQAKEAERNKNKGTTQNSQSTNNTPENGQNNGDSNTNANGSTNNSNQGSNTNTTQNQNSNASTSNNNTTATNNAANGNSGGTSQSQTSTPENNAQKPATDSNKSDSEEEKKKNNNKETTHQASGYETIFGDLFSEDGENDNSKEGETADTSAGDNNDENGSDESKAESFFDNVIKVASKFIDWCGKMMKKLHDALEAAGAFLGGALGLDGSNDESLLSDEFKKAVDDKNKTRVRILLKDSMLTDTSLKTFNSEENYASKNIDDLYDQHDGETLESDESKWNKDLYNTEAVKVVNNFSKERVEFLKKLVKKVFKNSKSDSNEEQTEEESVFDFLDADFTSYNEMVTSDEENIELIAEHVYELLSSL